MRRAKHNLSSYHLTTGEMGQLFPINCIEVLPGDVFQNSSQALIRVSPLAAPVMHPVQVRLHHFYIPSRIAAKFWSEDNPEFDFEKFITGGADGRDIQTIPTIDTTGNAGDLIDHFGIPRTAGIPINALPIAAFNMTYNEYYRDQQLGVERASDDVTTPHISWGKDYLTTARPDSVLGDDVVIPLGDTAPILSDGSFIWSSESGGQSALGIDTGPERAVYEMADSIPRQEALRYDSGLIADLSSATGASINDVRKAFALQRYQEARNKYGSRYTEYLRSMGVIPSDARLQRPELLGGGTTSINFSEVLQTGQEAGAEQNAVGDMYGHGIAALRSNRFRRFFEEHGYMITLMSVRPRGIYTQSINRMWLKQDKEDFFQKELQHIGMQEIYNNEVYADAVNGMDTFGYVDRYQEYRTQPSIVSNEFRDVLNYWHLGREFSSPPVLNQSFIDCVPSKRIHNEQTMNALWIMTQHKTVARRLVEKRATNKIL